MVSTSSKEERTHPHYQLLYHPTIPGRGEFIRLAFEAAAVPYTDVANEQKDGYSTVQATCAPDSLTSGDNNPPIFSPPALRIPSAGRDGQSDLIIHQTPAILAYLGEKLDLVPSDDAGRAYVQQLALTALDLNNEAHDTHHPIAVMQYYEDQKSEALAKATDFRTTRLPKFLSYFQRTLKYNQQFHGGEGKFLVGGKLTYADTTVWQVLDGLYFAFPVEMKARRKEFAELLEEFYGSVREVPGVRAYLESGNRLKYGMGVFRHYPELDRQ